MFDDIFTYEELIEACPEIYFFENITMLRDFGPLKKGEKYAQIAFLPDKSLCQIYLIETDGTPTKEFKFKLEAI